MTVEIKILAMTSNKLSSSRSISSLTAHILKIAGVIITLAAVVDLLITPMPYQFGDQQWQIDLVTSFVDRGTLPLVGIVLLLTGFGIDGTRAQEEQRAIWLDLRLWACLLASLLGLIYVLAFPLHLNNVRVANQTGVEQVNQQATQLETELSSRIEAGNNRIQTEIEARRQQINQLLSASDEQLQQLVANKQLTEDQANQVQKFKADPNSVEPFLKKQETELQTQLDTEVKKLRAEIDTRKQQAQDAGKTEALKSGLRVSLSSLLLAIGFITVGWTGLRNLR